MRDLVSAGAPEHLIREMRAAAAAVNEIEVLSDNFDPVNMFFTVQTQWRMAPMGGFVGLDYTAVWSVFNGLRVKNKPGVFAGVQVIERAALAEFARQRELS